MKRIATMSSNLLLSFQEDGGTLPEAEIVITVVEPDYVMRLTPPLVEGGQPQPQLTKFMKADTVRFVATISGIENMIDVLSAILHRFDTLAEGHPGPVDAPAASKADSDDTRPRLVVTP
jgi:hypothetical protein